MTNRVSRFAFGSDEIEVRLQVEPELRIDSEPVPEAQGRVAGDGALAVDDLAHTVGRHLDLPGELRGCDAELRQLVLQYLPGMDGSFQHLPLLVQEW